MLNIPLMIAAAVGVALTAPDYLIAAFNPVTLNVSVVIFALISYLVSADLPSAKRCNRQEKST